MMDEVEQDMKKERKKTKRKRHEHQTSDKHTKRLKRSKNEDEQKREPDNYILDANNYEDYDYGKDKDIKSIAVNYENTTKSQLCSRSPSWNRSLSRSRSPSKSRLFSRSRSPSLSLLTSPDTKLLIDKTETDLKKKKKKTKKRGSGHQTQGKLHTKTPKTPKNENEQQSETIKLTGDYILDIDNYEDYDFDNEDEKPIIVNKEKTELRSRSPSSCRSRMKSPSEPRSLSRSSSRSSGMSRSFKIVSKSPPKTRSSSRSISRSRSPSSTRSLSRSRSRSFSRTRSLSRTRYTSSSSGTRSSSRSLSRSRSRSTSRAKSPSKLKSTVQLAPNSSARSTQKYECSVKSTSQSKSKCPNMLIPKQTKCDIDLDNDNKSDSASDSKHSKIKSKQKPTPKSSGKGEWLKTYNIPQVDKERVNPPLLIDKRISPNTKYDIDLDESPYWKGVSLKVFQIKDIVKLLELSDEYILKELFLYPTTALCQWILYDREKVQHLPFLADKTLVYGTDSGGFQGKALQNAFKVSNISSTQVKEYCKNNLSCPTGPHLGDTALNILLSNPNIIVDNDTVEKQGIYLVKQTGGPVYCTL